MSKITRRRFTPDEDAIICADFPAYVPTLEIARKLGRDEGTVRQRIIHLGLRRSNIVSKIIGWAPPHLREQVSTLGAEAFIAACYAWRDQTAATASAEAQAEHRTQIEAACAEIDQNTSLSRDQKIIAKRMAGMTLEAIGKQHTLTRERVRQVTSPDFVARVRGTSIQNKLDKLEEKRTNLIGAELSRMQAIWEGCPQSVREEFLRRIGAALTGDSRSVRETTP